MGERCILYRFRYSTMNSIISSVERSPLKTGAIGRNHNAVPVVPVEVFEDHDRVLFDDTLRDACHL